MRATPSRLFDPSLRQSGVKVYITSRDAKACNEAAETLSKQGVGVGIECVSAVVRGTSDGLVQGVDCG